MATARHSVVATAAETHDWVRSKRRDGSVYVFRCIRCGKGVRRTTAIVEETCDDLLASGEFLRFLPVDPKEYRVGGEGS